MLECYVIVGEKYLKIMNKTHKINSRYWKTKKKITSYKNATRSEKIWDVIMSHTFSIKNAQKLYYIIKRFNKLK